MNNPFNRIVSHIITIQYLIPRKSWCSAEPQEKSVGKPGTWPEGQQRKGGRVQRGTVTDRGQGCADIDYSEWRKN